MKPRITRLRYRRPPEYAALVKAVRLCRRLEVLLYKAASLQFERGAKSKNYNMDFQACWKLAAKWLVLKAKVVQLEDRAFRRTPTRRRIWRAPDPIKRGERKQNARRQDQTSRSARA